jgi:hypothetical protein
MNMKSRAGEMRQCLRLALPACLLGMVLALPGLADQAADSYESLFGPEEKRVTSSPTKKDDAEFAQKLLAAATKLKDDPALRDLLLGKAYEIGSRNALGYVTAIDAMHKLAEADPARKAECRQKVLKVLDLRYRDARGPEQAAVAQEVVAMQTEDADEALAAGKCAEALAAYGRAYAVASRLHLRQAESLDRSIKAVTAREAVQKEKDRLTALRKANPNDSATAKKLLMICLVEEDDPAEAGKLLDAAQSGEPIQSELPLAAKPLAELTEDNAMELAGWYESLAEKAGDNGRPKMLARAKAYYQTFLTLHGQDDAKALKAKLQLAKVEKLLGKSGEPESPAVAGPPRDVTSDILAWTKKRDALPPQEQVEAVLKKLTEVNPGSAIKLRETAVIQDGKVVKLDFGGSKGLANVGPLFGLKLNHLNLWQALITHVEPLRGMPLEALDLADTNKLESLKGIEGMPLKALVVTQSRITSLRPLRGMKLTRLNIDGSRILESLDGIQGMPLVELHVYDGYQLADLDPIRGMKLEFLGIGYCGRVTDMTPIRGMPLKNLYANGMPFADLSLLEGMQATQDNPGHGEAAVGRPVPTRHEVRHQEGGGRPQATHPDAEDRHHRVEPPRSAVAAGGPRFSSRRLPPSSHAGILLRCGGPAPRAWLCRGRPLRRLPCGPPGLPPRLDSPADPRSQLVSSC